MSDFRMLMHAVDFDAGPVAFRHIDHDGFAYIVDLPGEDQLVTVMHVIEVQSGPRTIYG